MESSASVAALFFYMQKNKIPTKVKMQRLIRAKRVKDRKKLVSARVPEAVFGLVENEAMRMMEGGEPKHLFKRVQWLVRSKETGLMRVLGTVPHGVDARLKVPAKSRLIAQHRVPDKILLSCVSHLIHESVDWKLSSRSYAYRLKKRRLGMKQALMEFQTLVKKKNYFIAHLDIENFFGSISHSIILEGLKTLKVEKELITTVQVYLNWVANQQLGDAKGVLQGSPTSGILANVALHSLDRLLGKKRIDFIRYSDDLVILAPSEKKLKNAVNHVQKHLESIQLRLNSNKTQWSFLGKKKTPEGFLETVELLGFEFTKGSSFAIRKSSLKKAINRIHYWTSNDIGPNANYASVIEKINYFLGYEFGVKRKNGDPFHMTRDSGWVRHFAQLGFSPLMDRQMYEIDRLIYHRLKVWRKSSAGSKKIKWKVRTASGLYRTLCGVRQPKKWK